MILYSYEKHMYMYICPYIHFKRDRCLEEFSMVSTMYKNDIIAYNLLYSNWYY